MKIILGILFILTANYAISQNAVPTFIVSSDTNIENSILGGTYINSDENDISTQHNNLIFIKEMNEGDFILFEINKNDKKDYSLELINSDGEIIIAIPDFNASSFRIVKNTLQKGNYTVFLTEQETQKINTGTITL